MLHAPQLCCFADVRRVNFGIDQVCFAEIGTAQVRIAKVCIFQIRMGQVCAFEFCSAQIRTFQVCPLQIGVVQDQVAEVQARKISGIKLHLPVSGLDNVQDFVGETMPN